jgi:hypothetical protein
MASARPPFGGGRQQYMLTPEPVSLPTWQVEPWTEWETIPQPAGKSSIYMESWRFQYSIKKLPTEVRHRILIQVKFPWGETETHVVCREQLSGIVMKHCPDPDTTTPFVVEVATLGNTGYPTWSPNFIRYTFGSEENAHAFLMSLTDFVSSNG